MARSGAGPTRFRAKAITSDGKNDVKEAKFLRPYTETVYADFNNLDKLHGGRFLTDTQYSQVKEKGLAPGYYSKERFEQFDIRYDIVIGDDGDVYPIYAYPSFTPAQRMIVESLTDGGKPGLYSKQYINNTAAIFRVKLDISSDIVLKANRTIDVVEYRIQQPFGSGKLVQNPPSHPQPWSVLYTMKPDEKEFKFFQADFKALGNAGLLKHQKDLFYKIDTKSDVKEASFLAPYVRGDNKLIEPDQFRAMGRVVALFNQYMAQVFNKGFLHTKLVSESFYYDSGWHRVEMVNLIFLQKYTDVSVSRIFKKYTKKIVANTDAVDPSCGMAPEMRRTTKEYSEKTQVFDWGVLLKDLLLFKKAYIDPRDNVIKESAARPGFAPMTGNE